MKFRFILFLFSFAFVFCSIAGDNLSEKETELTFHLKNLRSAKNDQEKDSLNLIFKKEVKEAIEMKGAFHYPFSKLLTVGTIASPDSTFRLFNWNIEQDDHTQKYECLILKYNDKKKDYSIIELTDNSANFFGRNYDIIDAQNWYGALYYSIIPIEKGNRQMYTVLGWDGNDQSSTIKMIDVLYFSGNTVKLGSPIFKQGGELVKRVYFEHSKTAIMSLKYEPKFNRIIFDHLSPEAPNLVGFYNYYVPDMSYDAFYFGNNKWVLKEDIIGLNKAESNKIDLIVLDEETGETKTVRVKKRWQDPSDPNAPGGGAVHVAVTQEEETGGNSKDNKNKKSKKDKKKKNTPKSNISL